MTELLSFRELFAKASKVFRANFKKILALVILVVLPLAVVEGVIADVMNRDNAVEQLFEVLSSDDVTAEEANAAISEAVPRMAPYILLECVILLLSLVFTVSTVRLTSEDGLGSASYYLGFGIKCMPRIALAVIIGSFVAMLGFSLFFLPGLIIMVVTLTGVYYMVLTGEYGVRGLLNTGKLLLRRPPVALIYIMGSAAVRVLTFSVNLFALLLPEGESLTLSIANVAFSALGSCVGAVLTGFVTVTVSLAMINTLNCLGFRSDGEGYLKREEE